MLLDNGLRPATRCSQIWRSAVFFAECVDNLRFQVPRMEGFHPQAA